MCGFAGFLGAFDPALLDGLGERIAHRGPDDVGLFSDPDAGLGLVHRRLSIIDLSEAGHQPMQDRSGRYVISYNGELYNAPELREELTKAGIVFRGQSDTEVLLELLAHGGLSQLSRLNGIFAFALWDRHERCLHLVRDGMGVKPLYVAQLPQGVVFGSEMKALLAVSTLPRDLDPIAAMAYLGYLYSPGERTMLQAVKKLPPGTVATFHGRAQTASTVFYRPPHSAPQSQADAFLLAETRHRLAQAVNRQMLSDVPVGAFLSGGLDSSAIVAAVRQQQPDRALPCFTIDYAGRPGDESEMVADLPYARQAAKHLGVPLHEVRVDGSMADRFEELIYILDEPQADPAALNNMMIAQAARDMGIKVLLSGAGGDDLFTGYRRHQAARWGATLDRLPWSVRRTLAATAGLFPSSNTWGRRAAKVLRDVDEDPQLRVARMFEWLPLELVAELFVQPPEDAARQARVPFLHAMAEQPSASSLEHTLRLDQLFFLTDHNLNYTDKTGMVAGVEIRVPFLDPDMVAWAAALPARAKMRGGQTKWVLRKAMEQWLPKEIIYRPKTGFGVPLRAWMQREFAPLLADTLSTPSLEHRGLFSVPHVRHLQDATRRGVVDGSYTLLGVAAIELWCRRFLDRAALS